MAPQLKPGTIFVQNYDQKKSKLYTLNILNGQTSLVGEIAAEVYDLAFVGTELYGLKKKEKRGFGRRQSSMDLIKIDSSSGHATVVGNTGFEVAGLAYDAKNQLLYASSAEQIVAINPKTGKSKVVVDLDAGDRVCGEIAFNRAGQLFITLTGPDKIKYLATCELDSGNVSIIGDTEFPGLASMKFMDNILYGVAGKYAGLGGTDGQIVRLETTTGKGVLFNTTEPKAKWAGIGIVPIAQSAAQEITPPPGTSSSTNDSLTADSSTANHSTEEETMTQLTIDTKENCYVINTDGMKHLQESVASTYTLGQGQHSIRIDSGRYHHSQQATDGEPLVLLWIYGTDGSTFINQNTGIEVGATWVTLNGYHDVLQIEAQQPISLNALFFSYEGSGATGTVTLSITSGGTTERLTVDSQQNSFLLDQSYLSGLQQSDINSLELAPGNYRFNIRESSATYWNNEKKFDLEPWALLRVQGGRFVTELTGTETSESWCSLNGLQDTIVLEVKETTTVSGFFFDTYKEDNEGQIILEVNPVSEADVSSGYELVKVNLQQIAEGNLSENVTINASGATTVSNSQSVGKVSTERQEIFSQSSSGGSSGSSSQSSSRGFEQEFAFTFQFDSDKLEETWQQVSSQTEAAVSTEQTERDTQRWDQLESWIMRTSQEQVKKLSQKVARNEFLLKTLTQQIELSFNQTFEAWTGYFDQRLIELLDTKIATIIEEQIDAKVTIQTEEAKVQVRRDILGELDQRIDTNLQSKVMNLRNDVTSLVAKEMTTTVSESFSRLDEQLNIKISNKSEDIKASVTQDFQGDLDRRIEAILEGKVINLRNDISSTITREMTGNISDAFSRLNEQLDIKISDKSEDIKTLVISDFQGELDRRIAVNIENKVVNLRNDISSVVNREMTSRISESVKSDVLANIKKQQLAFDVNSFRAEIGKFYSQLAQFESKINSRIAQGDTELYNWTLEQIVTLQGCITDRQALVNMFDSFSAELKSKLDNADCVQPTRFEPWVRVEDPQQLASTQPKQLSSE